MLREKTHSPGRPSRPPPPAASRRCPRPSPERARYHQRRRAPANVNLPPRLNPASYRGPPPGCWRLKTAELSRQLTTPNTQQTRMFWAPANRHLRHRQRCKNRRSEIVRANYNMSARHATRPQRKRSTASRSVPWSSAARKSWTACFPGGIPMLSYSDSYSTKKGHGFRWVVMASDLVGRIGFEPVTSSVSGNSECMSPSN
jgi:hypothetical protein